MKKSDMAITREFWTSSLVDVAKAICNTEHHQSRWLATDALAWERPEELICTIFDDLQLQLFIEKHGSAFSEAQSEAAVALRDELTNYCNATQQFLDPETVLADPQWEAVRRKARDFVNAFQIPMSA
jgi:small-conductance mechanosensitive channel